MPALRAALPLALLLVTAGCELYQTTCDDLGNMLDSPAGLEVTEAEHPTGWAQANCWQCHHVDRMHTLNCSGLDELDIEGIRERVEDEGLESCSSCHGNNGVQP